MSRPSISTPCPAPTRRVNTLPSFDDQDDTSQIEYTRVIQREFAHARPRRPARRDNGPTIYEDAAQEEETHRFGKREEPARRGVLLGKRPTKRVPVGSVGKTAGAPPVDVAREDAGALQAGIERSAVETAKRDSRRRTIYVPSDDTTMMTIHPGANNTHKLDDTFQLPTYQPQSLLDCIAQSPPSTENQHVPTKKARMSLAAAPRRVPLGQVEAKSINVPASDVAGEGGGKENLPPKHTAGPKTTTKSIAVKPVAQTKISPGRSKLFESTAASQSRQTVQSRKAVPITRTKMSPHAPAVQHASERPLVKARQAREKLQTAKANIAMEGRVKEASPRTKAPPVPKPWRKSANFVSASDASKAKLQRYQILDNDISQPDLYEDSWLDQQETALTEIINQILADVEPSTLQNNKDGQSLRESLLAIYDQPHVAMLHKRLQASLCYGALSKPKDMLTPPDLTQDLGLRKRFVQLWMDSYNVETLCAAAEVVVGRKMPATSSSGLGEVTASNQKSMDTKESRRAIIGFLETFFVTVEDLENSHGTHEDLQTQRRNKTVSRSLMLAWLLDQAAASGVQSKRLFKVKSAYKTSAAVLNSLAGMLIPSAGDIGRALRHMDFTVSHVQDPLDEVVFRINNLAVDLRDGIMLTKLVELLLYHTSSKVWDRTEATDDTVTIILPDATILQSALYAEDGSQQNRVLTQHLKMPCVGHAKKMYNVDIALQALAGHHRTANIVTANVSAETIVDGHRENTLNLLWSLVSSVGLDVLLDKEALINDIALQDIILTDFNTLPTDTLLQKWAAVYCSPERIHITNLTTSFATGAPYAAIVAAFSDFFAPSSKRSSLSNSTASTASRLRAMGCSEAFIKQLTSTTTSIPTRQTTLANLAFLASRLLPLAKRFHAATTIQRAFRAKRARVVLGQRVALMKVAAACAVVVRERQRVAGAAVVVQRAWRAVVHARVERLDANVLAFQRVARGWMERRRVAGAKRSGRKGVVW